MPVRPVHEQNMDFARGACFQQYVIFQAAVCIIPFQHFRMRKRLGKEMANIQNNLSY